MKSAKEFLENKGWAKDNPVIGGVLFDGICDLLEQYAAYKFDWISVKDGLPKEQCHCLVATGRHFPKNYRGVVAEFYPDVNVFYCESSDEPITDATHYIILLDEPKK